MIYNHIFKTTAPVMPKYIKTKIIPETKINLKIDLSKANIYLSLFKAKYKIEKEIKAIKPGSNVFPKQKLQYLTKIQLLKKHLLNNKTDCF